MKAVLQLMLKVAVAAILAACLASTGLASDTCSVDSTNFAPRLKQDREKVLDSFIVDFMESGHIPGLSASVVKDGRVIWTGSYGHAYVVPLVDVTDSTLFMAASISKTLTATALMQLYEYGAFDLHDPISDYLPFEVRHPRYVNVDITFHMLLTHTSGIYDNWDNMPFFQGDSPIPLGEYLESYLVPGGEYYDWVRNFTVWRPGTRYVYCNIAAALVGYLTEVISGTPFDVYCQENLFAPLEMIETSWFLADLDPSHVAMPYHWNGTGYGAYGHYGYPEYPAGQLRTSAPQLLNFLTAYLQGGEFKGSHILDASTVAMMTTSQVPDVDPQVGILWHTGTLGGRVLWGHGGGGDGVRTLMYFCPAENSGVVIFTNGETYVTTLLDKLFDYAESHEWTPTFDPRNMGRQIVQ